MTAHLLTDDPVWASSFLHPARVGPFQSERTGAIPEPLVAELFGAGAAVSKAPILSGLPSWLVLLRREAPESQFDVLLGLARSGVQLPPVVVAVAGSGSGFHGSGGRPWVALEGNLHVCVLFTLERPQPLPLPLVTPFVVNVTADTVEALPGFEGRVGIKWVNDLLVDGQKVGGALAATLTQGSDVSTLLIGMGLNVGALPTVERGSHTPPAGALAHLASRTGSPLPEVGGVLVDLLGRLHGSFHQLMEDPDRAGADILREYRGRSLILGQEVQVVEDQAGPAEPVGRPVAQGRVRAIGPGLELHLDGHPVPVTRGRLLWPLA